LADGRIVYDSVVRKQETGTWLMNGDGSNSERFLPEGIPETMSPDGQFLLYRKTNLGPLWLRDLKNGNEKQLTDHQSAFGAFSPDGKEVIYNHMATLWVASLDGEPSRQTEIPVLAFFPAVSPDGSRVAFLKLPGFNVGIASIDSGTTARVLDVHSEDQGRYARGTVEWTPDGKFISYIARVGGVPNIWKVPVNGGDPIQVTTFQSGRLFNFAYSADGKSIVLSRGDVESDVFLIKNSE